METTVNIVLPVFGLVLCGYLVGRSRILTEAGIDGLTTFVFYVAIPVLLFRTVIRNELPAADDLAIVFAYFTGCYALFFIAMLAGRLFFKLPLDQLAVMAMGAVYSNTVLLGLPLVFATYGEAGMLPILIIIGFHSALLIPLTILLIELGQGTGRGRLAVVVSSVKTTAVNPVVIALAAAVLFSAAGLTLVEPADRFAQLLSGAAAPCALFALGASLAAYRIAGDLKQTLTMVAFKLVALPALVWLLSAHVFGLDPLWTAVATITAAMPSGANVFIYARSYGIYVARATSATLVSTGLSIVTVAVLLALLTPS